MKNPIKTLQPNLVGRDFVIGDLHGSYSAFENLLKNINFDPVVDRIISVGDMVDRGPESLKCLSLLLKPWFHAVLANHEHMMAAKFKNQWQGNSWFPNGGNWGFEAWTDFQAMHTPTGCIPNDTSVELFDLLPLVDELPFIITLTTKDGKKYHVIHAELPSGVGPITDADLADPAKLVSLATVERNHGDAFLWARNIFDPFCKVNLGNRDTIVRTVKYFHHEKMFNDNLSHIISGHTILQKPMTVVGQTNIDTGAYSSYWYPVEPYSSRGYAPTTWGALTCIELDLWKFYQATENTFKEINPFVVTKEDLSA